MCRTWFKRALLVSTLLILNNCDSKVRFRSEGIPLTEDDVKSIIVKHNFYDSKLNKTGDDFPNNYVVSKDGKAIYDYASGLMWQQDGVYGNIEEVRTKLDQMNSERFAGYTDWRLPTIEEAMTLVEKEANINGTSIDTVFAKHPSSIFTNDLLKISRGFFVWVVDFGDASLTTIPLYSKTPLSINGLIAVRSIKQSEFPPE